MKIRRRKFLLRGAALGAIGIAAMLPYGVLRSLVPTVAARPQNRLRPPGALINDDAFVAACIGCGACAEICPPRCIDFYSRAGGDKVNTPYIDPELKSCILCGLCMEVCPTDALTITDRHDVRMGIAQIDRAACYPWVDRGVCGACVTVCPLGEQAINFDFANFYRPVVLSGCVGCGQCVEVCPHPSLPIKIVDPSLGTTTRHSVA